MMRTGCPTDEEIKAALDDLTVIFGPVFEHCEGCEGCRRRWLDGLRIGRIR